MLSEATLGDAQPIDYRTFVGELRGASRSLSYAPDDSGAGIFTASVLDARGLSFRAVALLGLAEGEFPQAEREDVLLRETDRAVLRDRGLSIEPQLRGDEVTFFYQAVTRATDRLLLSRPYLAARWSAVGTIAVLVTGPAVDRSTDRAQGAPRRCT